MERELPELEIDGTTFQFDINQLALVEKDRPEEKKLFFDEMNDCTTHYEFVYNRHSKRLDLLRTQDGIDAYITGKHSFANIKVPRIGEIDPIGMSEKYHCSLDDIRQKSDFEIMVNQEVYDLRLNKGVLPTIEIAGHTFYVDIQMDKLRPKDDFLSNGIVFSDIQKYYDREKQIYTIPYNPATREFQEPDYSTIKEFPKDLIAVKFPSERLLDQIGWNRKNGYEMTDGLIFYGLKLQFAAKNVPWKKTFLADVIKSNLKAEKKLKKATEKQQPIQPRQSKRNHRKM